MFPLNRYDERRGGIEAGYPRDMRNWRGVPPHIDGAITWRDGETYDLTYSVILTIFYVGITYFFKDGKYWRCDDHMVVTDSEVLVDTATQWFNC